MATNLCQWLLPATLYGVTEQVLGFVGLGRMGGPMAGRLAVAGHRVIGFDLAGAHGRLPEGAVAAASVEAVVGAAEIVFLSLPDGAASLAVCRQIADAPERRTRVVVDLSTIGIKAARECAALLAPIGLTYVDAPVSGGVAGARSGSLAMMVGVEAPIFEALEPLLVVLAANRFRVGDAPGQGQAMKLLNNFISAAAMAATSEAVVFGARMGLDLAKMIDVINVSSGRTTASTDKFPRSVIPRSYDFGFAGALMAKDAALYAENADAADVPHQLGASVARLWQEFHAARPDADFTAIHKYLEELSGAAAPIGDVSPGRQ
ncbi:MAG: NAD(P)-dependent oxidoreductase [Chloroflexi bacterium]|nr:NAD(P)-dependent oxidoreductase [Chloroflexota bacterium]